MAVKALVNLRANKVLTFMRDNMLQVEVAMSKSLALRGSIQCNRSEIILAGMILLLSRVKTVYLT